MPDDRKGMGLNVFDAIRTRRSIRRYKAQLVEQKKLDQVVEAGRLAPSAKNLQPWHFVLVTDGEQRRALRAAYASDWFVGAPAILVACGDPSVAWRRMDGEEYWKVDVSIAMENMVLAARELGLGTCWIGAFDEKAAKTALKVPDGVRVLAMTPIGYPDEEKGEVKNRKTVEEILHRETW